jgi:GLPGLI family protein
MKRFLSLFLLLTIGVKAQDISGVATYQTKTSIDLKMESKEITPEMQEQIQSMLKKQFEKTYTLTFNANESVYQEEQSLDAAVTSGGFSMIMGSFTGGKRYKNIKNNQYKEETEFFGKPFLIEDELQNIEWELVNESKQIGQYVVFKAIATQKIDSLEFTEYERKKEEEKDESDTIVSPIDELKLPKEKKIVAWYTPQIPIKTGPDEYWGLPGLILELQSGKTTMLCSKIILNPKEAVEIDVPTKGKSVSRDEYKKIMMDKVNEMQSMYKSRGGGNFEIKIGN